MDFSCGFFPQLSDQGIQSPCCKKSQQKGVKMGLIYFMVKYTPAIANIFFPYLFVSGEKDVFP